MPAILKLEKCLNISSVNAKEKGQRSEVIQAICLLFFPINRHTLKICIHYLFSEYLDSTRLLICTISRLLKRFPARDNGKEEVVLESWRMLKDKNKLQTSRYLSSKNNLVVLVLGIEKLDREASWF